MKTQFIIFLGATAALTSSAAQAHSAKVLPCTGIPSLAFDVGLSDTSNHDMRLGIPDLGVEMLFCTERMLAGEYMPVWFGARFGYKENSVRANSGTTTTTQAVRDFEISFLSAMPVNPGFEFGFGPKLILSSPHTDSGVSNFAVQGEVILTLLPWRAAKPENNGVLGGALFRLYSGYGIEIGNGDSGARWDTGLKLGYRFGGT